MRYMPSATIWYIIAIVFWKRFDNVNNFWNASRKKSLEILDDNYWFPFNILHLLHSNNSYTNINWYERVAFQSVGVRWLTGNKVSGHYNRHSFLFFSFFPLFFLCCLLFSEKEGSHLKPFLAKVDGSAQKPGATLLSRPRQPFWRPLVAILEFEVLIEGIIKSKHLLPKFDRRF